MGPDSCAGASFVASSESKNDANGNAQQSSSFLFLLAYHGRVKEGQGQGVTLTDVTLLADPLPILLLNSLVSVHRLDETHFRVAHLDDHSLSSSNASEKLIALREEIEGLSSQRTRHNKMSKRNRGGQSNAKKSVLNDNGLLSCAPASLTEGSIILVVRNKAIADAIVQLRPLLLAVLESCLGLGGDQIRVRNSRVNDKFGQTNFQPQEAVSRCLQMLVHLLVKSSRHYRYTKSISRAQVRANFDYWSCQPSEVQIKID